MPNPIIKTLEINDGVQTPVQGDIGADAANVDFNNTSSGLSSSNIQAVIDEIIAQYGYAECSTAGNIAAKTASITNYTLRIGNKVAIKFTYNNTATNPTLNISNTGEKPILANGSPANKLIKENSVFLVNYNGTAYEIIGGTGSGNGIMLKATYDTTPALYDHAVNDIIYFNELFYKVTAAIEVDDVIAVGTNIVVADLDANSAVYIDKLPKTGGGGSGGGFDYYYELFDSTTTLTKDSEGNVTQSVKVNPDATITTVFNRINGEITSIVSTIVPVSGNYNYVKTTAFSGNTITVTCQTVPKSDS